MLKSFLSLSNFQKFILDLVVRGVICKDLVRSPTISSSREYYLICASTILQYFINLLWYFEMWMDWKTFAYTLYFCYLVWIKSICIRIWLLFWPFLVSSNWTFGNTDFRTEMTKSSKWGHFWGVECQICGRINQWAVDDRVPGGWLVAKWAIWRDPTWSVPGITTNYNSISPDYPRDLLLTRMEGIKNWGKMLW